jgi:hypothetical protein
VPAAGNWGRRRTGCRAAPRSSRRGTTRPLPKRHCRPVPDESLLAASLSRLEAVYGDPLAALDHVTLAIRTNHAAVNTTGLRGALAILAVVFDRLGRYEPATMAGFAVNPLTAQLAYFNTVIAHLRDVLGERRRTG